ncbi:sigma-70 family RNA polymerase sigma factor [candidate division KSB1 bacterium]|nr:sigma-70 family RNA polymerase sigma factor [candidate division KSB1 bacterium]
MPTITQEWNNKLDVWLIGKVLNGNARAFERLVQKYQQHVYRTIIRMVKDHGTADDLIQQTFIKVYTNLDKFDTAYPFFPWIRRIAVNETLNLLKSKSEQRKKSIESLDDKHIPVQAWDNPLRNMEKKEFIRQLERAVNDLPLEQKTVFILRTQEEMSYQEIADDLDISVGTVMSRLNRARCKLKTALLDY